MWASWEGLEVKHIAIDNKDDLYKLRGSKYVKSKVCYSLLNTDRLVLFSGTPCQMPISKDNLLLVDVVCHGTPKTEVFNEYCKKYGIKKINFRDKTNGWLNYQVVTETEKETKKENFYENDYMNMFLSNKHLNESCYNCKFKNFKSNSDIQIGDFWGIQNEYPDFFDNKGISLVMVKTPKGEGYFERIKPHMDYIEVDIEKAIKYNPCIVKSVTKGI